MFPSRSFPIPIFTAGVIYLLSGELHQTAAAVEEIASAVRQTAATAAEAMVRADEASASAMESDNVMKKTIGMMQSVSADNSKIVDMMVASTETHLTAMIDNVINMSSMIKEISTATNEQTQALELINQSVSRIGTMTHNNTSMVEQVTSAAEDLSGRTARLHRAVHVFGGS
ncbi:MAG: chemotaxis protein [Proteobacteria bacterium]|nr:chemotaxis protein [Pseudomonadota bacterium]